METVRAISAHLILRNMRESDFDAVFAYRSHPDGVRYVGDPMNAEQVIAHIARYKDGWSHQEGAALNLAVELRDGGAVIGEVALRSVSVQYRQMEFGLALHPLYQRKGLGREATLAGLRYCFQDLAMHRVIGFVDVENQPSLRLGDSLQLRREGILRKNAFRYGEWRDEYLVAMLEDEWPEVRRRFQHLLIPPACGQHE